MNTAVILVAMLNFSLATYLIFVLKFNGVSRSISLSEVIALMFSSSLLGMASSVLYLLIVFILTP